MMWLAGPPSPSKRHWTARWLAVSTAGFLFYNLIAAANAQSVFDVSNGAFGPLSHLAWLPHSYDRSASWLAFWQNMALAGTFWAARSWLLRAAPSTGLLPKRARVFLMFMVTNGFLLAVIALLQRLDKTQKLLWLVKPRINQSPGEQFGPFAYRGNGLEYIGLLWPVALGLWSMYSGAQRQDRLFGRRSWLLLCALTMAACPFLWESRLAAAINAAILLLAAGILFASHRLARPRIAVLTVVAGAIALGLAVNWRGILERFAKAGLDTNGRAQLWQAGWAMFSDHWLFGVGPGAFRSLYPLYRTDLHAPWLAQMHCDWLQTLATYGIVGSAFLGAGLAALFFSPGQSGKLPARYSFVILASVGLIGCLAAATVDFPFQVYSIEQLFVVLAAFLSVLSVRGCTSSNPAEASGCFLS